MRKVLSAKTHIALSSTDHGRYGTHGDSAGTSVFIAQLPNLGNLWNYLHLPSPEENTFSVREAQERKLRNHNCIRLLILVVLHCEHDCDTLFDTKPTYKQSIPPSPLKTLSSPQPFSHAGPGKWEVRRRK